MQNKPQLIVIVDSRNPKSVIGFSSEIPLGQVFALLLIGASGTPAPVEMIVRTSDEMGLEPNVGGGKESLGSMRPSKMDPALRARTDCPVVPNVASSAGEIGAMLSILSERVSEGRKK